MDPIALCFGSEALSETSEDPRGTANFGAISDAETQSEAATWLNEPTLSSMITTISASSVQARLAYSGCRWYPPPRTRLRAVARIVIDVESGLTLTTLQLKAHQRSYCLDLPAAAIADSTLDTGNKMGTCLRSAQLLIQSVSHL